MVRLSAAICCFTDLRENRKTNVTQCFLDFFYLPEKIIFLSFTSLCVFSSPPLFSSSSPPVCPPPLLLSLLLILFLILSSVGWAGKTNVQV